MSGPVVVTAVLHPAPGARDAVLEVMHRALPLVHEEPGCELYAIHDAPDGTIVMLEKWSSVEELDAHGVGQPVEVLREGLKGLLSAPTEVVRLDPIPIGDARGAL